MTFCHALFAGILTVTWGGNVQAFEYSAGDKQESLPRWSLGDYYTGGINDPQIHKDLDALRNKVEIFSKAYKGRLAALSAEQLGKAISEYEVIEELAMKVGAFAFLAFSTAQNDGVTTQFHQQIGEQLKGLTKPLAFFSLELNSLTEDDIKGKISQSTKLAYYAPWLRKVRLAQPHQLSEELERLMQDMSQAGIDAWAQFYEEVLASIHVAVKEERIPLSKAIFLLQHKDEAKRKAAYEGIIKALSAHQNIFKHVFNALTKSTQISTEWRHFAHPADIRHLANDIDPKDIEVLTAQVKAQYAHLSHRYYRLKAKWLGKKKLEMWDRFAPLPFADDRAISWEEAKKIVLDAYGAFSPKLAELVRKFFENPWIDVPAVEGKNPGAFNLSGPRDVHPYILLNYFGKQRDVMTLAHELGHGAHGLLSQHLGVLLAEKPVTIAETASIFGETLAFKALLKEEKDPLRRKALIAARVEDMLGTVVRQISFYDFECQLHAARAKGPLSLEQIGDLWETTQKETYGDAVNFTADARITWGYVHHFMRPFYVYSYAFGLCLVNALYNAYEDYPAGFEDKFLTLLKSGGSKTYEELLKPFGLDPKDPSFWQKGLSVLSKMIDDLEAMEGDTHLSEE